MPPFSQMIPQSSEVKVEEIDFTSKQWKDHTNPRLINTNNTTKKQEGSAPGNESIRDSPAWKPESESFPGEMRGRGPFVM